MKNRIKFILFLLIRGTGFFIDLFFLNLFLWLNFEFVFARSMGILGVLIYNFSMDRNVVFSAKNGSIKKQIMKYVLIYIVASLVNLTVSLFFSGIFGEGIFNSNLASILGIIFQIPITFFSLLFWVFSLKADPLKLKRNYPFIKKPLNKTLVPQNTLVNS